MQKKILIALPVLIVLTGFALWLKGNDMKEVKTEITINASPSKVWAVLTDFNSWTQWNSTVTATSGDASVGSQLNITMCGKEGSDGPQYSPKITVLDSDKSLHWHATMGPGFVFTNLKEIGLTPAGNGTKLVHKELFGGIMAAMMGGKMETGVPPMLNRFNEDLKKKVEGS